VDECCQSFILYLSWRFLNSLTEPEVCVLRASSLTQINLFVYIILPLFCFLTFAFLARLLFELLIPLYEPQMVHLFELYVLSSMPSSFTRVCFLFSSSLV
jgi:hypothetical protein